MSKWLTSGENVVLFKRPKWLAYLPRLLLGVILISIGVAVPIVTEDDVNWGGAARLIAAKADTVLVLRFNGH